MISQPRKRHSSPHPLPSEPAQKYQAQDEQAPESSSFFEDDGPQLTMEEKLQLAQVEAEEAGAVSVKADEEEDLRLDLEVQDDLGTLRSPAKKSKIKGRPRRRKSTLSPEELERLLGLEDS